MSSARATVGEVLVENVQVVGLSDISKQPRKPTGKLLKLTRKPRFADLPGTSPTFDETYERTFFLDGKEAHRAGSVPIASTGLAGAGDGFSIPSRRPPASEDP